MTILVNYNLCTIFLLDVEKHYIAVEDPILFLISMIIISYAILPVKTFQRLV